MHSYRCLQLNILLRILLLLNNFSVTVELRTIAKDFAYQLAINSFLRKPWLHFFYSPTFFLTKCLCLDKPKSANLCCADAVRWSRSVDPAGNELSKETKVNPHTWKCSSYCFHEMTHIRIIAF